MIEDSTRTPRAQAGATTNVHASPNGNGHTNGKPDFHLGPNGSIIIVCADLDLAREMRKVLFPSACYVEEKKHVKDVVDRRAVVMAYFHPLSEMAARLAATWIETNCHAERVGLLNLTEMGFSGPAESFVRWWADSNDTGKYNGAPDFIDQADRRTQWRESHPGDTVPIDLGEGFVGSVGTPQGVSPDFSGVDPKPLVPDLPPVPRLDPKMIPVAFRGWCEDIARRMCCPLEYVAATLVVVLGGLIGRKVAIRPKRRDDWQVIVNLWGAVVGMPGWLKTPAVEEVLRPLKRLVADAIDEHARELAEWKSRAMVAKAKREAAESDLRRAAKKKDLSEQDMLDLALAASEGEGEAEPKPKRYLTNDATIEKIGELLVENPNGLIQFRDELIGFLRSFDKNGHEGDRAFYLEGWNGNGSYDFDRIGRGNTSVKGLCLSVFGGIQPGPLAKYLKGTFSGEEADGFIPRFQVLVYPDPPGKFVNVDEYPDVEKKNRAYQVIRNIDQFDAVAAGCTVDDASDIPYIRFTDEAQAFFDGWREELENRLRGGLLNDVMAAHLAKFRSLMPSLAGIFHVAEHCDQLPIGRINLESAMMAAAWCQFLEAHAQRIYQSAMEGGIDTAVRLAERLKQSIPNPFSCRTVAQKGWSGLGTVEEVRKAVGILEDRGWVKTIEIPPTDRGGRPKEEIWVNPAIQKEQGGGA